jgi:broad specificity phosphatase PhoE
VSKIHFLAHPEVSIDPNVPVPNWSLSDVGRGRLEQFCKRTVWLRELTRLVSSTETKAYDGAKILKQHFGLPLHQDAGLNEIDRSSTGYVPKAEHILLSKAAFANPELSIRGWEKVVDAQKRIQGVVAKLVERYPRDNILISSHGAVGVLLLCSLLREPISSRNFMKNAGGGCYFSFESRDMTPTSGWVDIDD